MIALAALLPVLSVAIVVEDHAVLRAAPQLDAPRSVALARGDWLEVRGERAGFLQVYDHRRERPGYARTGDVRRHLLDESAAPALRAVIDFVKDSPGAESLGIGYVALYLRAAPSSAPTADVLDALGTMAERLADRASAKSVKDTPGAPLATQLDAAASYGVTFIHREIGGRTVTCYDGDAFRRVLAIGGSPVERQRAALALTRPACVDENLGPVERTAWNEWRLEVLRRADPTGLAPWEAAPLRLRAAGILGELTWDRARHGDTTGADKLASEAMRELALVDRRAIAESDVAAYDEAALRVAAVRWASEPVRSNAHARIELALGEGTQPGETCVELRREARSSSTASAPTVPRGAASSSSTASAATAPRGAASSSSTASAATVPRGAARAKVVLARRCTFATVWPASLRVSPDGRAAALAVSPLAGWSELWIFRAPPASDDKSIQWNVDPLLPATRDPDLGYVELAGWTPDSRSALVVREARRGQHGVDKQFQVLRLETLGVERHARDPEQLLAFRRWADASWRGSTIALR